MDDYHPTYEPISSSPKRKKPRPKKNRGGKKSGAEQRRRKRARLLAIDPHCKYCGCLLTEATATLDHVTPRGNGGTNANANLVLACKPCNTSKGDKLLTDWQKEKQTRQTYLGDARNNFAPGGQHPARPQTENHGPRI